MENLRVRRAGFAYRRLYELFLERYKSLCPETWPKFTAGPPRAGVQIIMEKYTKSPDDYRMGEWVPSLYILTPSHYKTHVIEDTIVPIDWIRNQFFQYGSWIRKILIGFFLLRHRLLNRSSWKDQGVHQRVTHALRHRGRVPAQETRPGKQDPGHIQGQAAEEALPEDERGRHDDCQVLEKGGRHAGTETEETCGSGHQRVSHRSGGRMWRLHQVYSKLLTFLF